MWSQDWVSGLHSSLTPFPLQLFRSSSSSHNLQTFFHPILRHLLNTALNSPKSFASRRSFWAAFKSSRDAIAGMVHLNNSHRAEGIEHSVKIFIVNRNTKKRVSVSCPAQLDNPAEPKILFPSFLPSFRGNTLFSPWSARPPT